MPAVAAFSPAEPRLPPGAPPDPAPHRAPAGPPDGRFDPAAEPGEAAARQGPRARDPEQRARLAERLERCRRPAAPEPDPPSLADGLEPAERPAFAALCRAFLARLDPADCGERILVEAIAACHFRRARLDAIEARLGRALLEGRPTEGLPSLPALARVRSALDREQRKLERDLQRLYALRPEPIRYPGLNPVRLRWLAERIEEGRLRAWSPPEPAEEPSAEGASVSPAETAGGARHAAPEPANTPGEDVPPRARGGEPRRPTPEPASTHRVTGSAAPPAGAPSGAAAAASTGASDAGDPAPPACEGEADAAIARVDAAGTGPAHPIRGAAAGAAPAQSAASGRPLATGGGLSGSRPRSA